MINFINKLNRFMYGRYGIDELYKFLLIICFVLLIINIFLNNIVITIIENVIFVFTIYRVLSKKKNIRNKENKIYLSIKNKILNFIKYQKEKYCNRNTHMYKKCPNCKQKIRLPLKKGKHTVKCPNCSHRFNVKCRKNEKIKIEIVK
ncbi:MAG: hypothetical protein IJZ46_00200 [Bacilli bacterium]|nr:hypothetical protein [Bacilli bacterium]